MTGGRPRPDLEPRLHREGDLLYGLGVQNPKGSVTCAIAALDAVLRAGVPLKGSASVGIAAGGIHKGPRGEPDARLSRPPLPGLRRRVRIHAHARLTADYCISTKPGYGIVWEEPGECWFKITIMASSATRASVTSSPTETLSWMPPRSSRRSRTGSPTTPDDIQGARSRRRGTVGGIEAGWPFKPEFIPASACSTSTSTPFRDAPHRGPARVRGADRRHPRKARGDRDRRRNAAVHPGSRTEPTTGSSVRPAAAIEAVEGRPIVVSGLSGTTDGAILRNAGIATARIGLPAWPSPNRTGRRCSTLAGSATSNV